MSLSTHLEELAWAAQTDFQGRFGRPARWVVAAPGRVNLIGEHTDYNDGFVLPMAIDRHVVLVADRAPAGAEARLFSMALGQEEKIAFEGAIRPGPVHWASYVQG